MQVWKNRRVNPTGIGVIFTITSVIIRGPQSLKTPPFFYSLCLFERRSAEPRYDSVTRRHIASTLRPRNDLGQAQLPPKMFVMNIVLLIGSVVVEPGPFAPISPCCSFASATGHNQ